MRAARLIREARRRAGITQAELARRLGTTQSVVARWETGRTSPSLDTVLEAVRACGLDLEVALVEPDRDHERLITDSLRLTPAERLADLVDRLDTERRLHRARRAG